MKSDVLYVHYILMCIYCTHIFSQHFYLGQFFLSPKRRWGGGEGGGKRGGEGERMKMWKLFCVDCY